MLVNLIVLPYVGHATRAAQPAHARAHGSSLAQVRGGRAVHAGGAAAAGVALAPGGERATQSGSAAHAPYRMQLAAHTHTRAHAATLSGAESPEARPPTPARELVAGGGLNAAELASD